MLAQSRPGYLKLSGLPAEDPERRGPSSQRQTGVPVLLTVKLRGGLRRQAALRSNEAHWALPRRPEWRRGRAMVTCARGAKQEAHHGPLQRLLEGLVRGSIEGT